MTEIQFLLRILGHVVVQIIGLLLDIQENLQIPMLQAAEQYLCRFQATGRDQ